ncbi:MAG: phage virion morphogenesis protein [Gallionella sp.]|nr:phage virion morphogenesis protein [Gallionella sp.]
MIEIKVDNKSVLDSLERLSKAAANPRPALLTIGEHLVKTTKARFDTSTAPDGTKWKPNKESTYLKQLVNSKGGISKSLHGKSGRINASGERKIMSKRPLVDKGPLGRSSISYYLSGGDLFWGSSMKYAAMQQFGGEKSRFPNLWGDIPDRPFLGVSLDDESKILSVVNDFLRSAV